MSTIIYRQISELDIPSLADIRVINWGTKQYWFDRINNYYHKLSHPTDALLPRILFAAIYNEQIIAFIAGHLSKRFNCDGELQWIDTIAEYRGRGIASQLVKLLAQWFVENKAYKICVDPGNQDSRKFYQKNGAIDLNRHWMYWNDIRNIL
jgi:GNAT superfamily N-acetyltransferase